MTYKEIKLKDFIIEVDVNEEYKFIYDVYVFTKNNNFLFSYTDIHEVELNNMLIEIEAMLSGFLLNKEDLDKGFDSLIDFINENNNRLIEGNRAFEFNNYMLANDEGNKMIVVFKDGSKLFEFKNNSPFIEL